MIEIVLLTALWVGSMAGVAMHCHLALIVPGERIHRLYWMSIGFILSIVALMINLLFPVKELMWELLG